MAENPTPNQPSGAPKKDFATAWANMPKEQRQQAIGTAVLLVGGLIVALIFLPRGCSNSPSSSSGGGSHKTFASEQEVRKLILGKTEEEVVNILGKPDFEFGAGKFTDGTTFQSAWDYDELIEHRTTGRKLNIRIMFNGGKAVETNMTGG